MPQLDLANLSGPELRRLLDASRARGEATLSYNILQEMAARRERDARGRAAKRRGAEPRVVEMNLGDPIEPEDDVPPMPNWRPPEPETPAVAREAEAAPSPRRKTKAVPTAATTAPDTPTAEPLPALELKPPRSVWDDDPPATVEPADPMNLSLGAPPRGSETARPHRRFHVPGAGFAAGIALGAALGWWAGDMLDVPPSPSTNAPLAIETAALVAPPAFAAVAEAQPEPEEAPAPAVEAAAPELAESPPSAPDADDGARDATAQAVEPLAAPALSRVAADDACAAEPTPADREICSDPDLQRLQRELRQAYAEALEAHEDRGLLRQRQLAWRDARNTVAEPSRLAQLYEQRIRKLNSATAAARQQR